MSFRPLTSRSTHTRGLIGERHPIITPFPTNSLTSTDFGWMHAETWDDEDRAFFLANRQTLVANFYRTPPPQYREDRPRGGQVGRWLLRQGEERVSTAEAHLFFNKFKRLDILLGPVAESDQTAREVSFLLSGLLLMSDCDQAVVVCPPHLTLSHLPESRSILGFNADERCSHHQICPIDPTTWWASTEGAELRETLRYLETRRRRQESMNAHKKRPRKRRGLLSRLFRP